jgi:hypothetical protein
MDVPPEYNTASLRIPTVMVPPDLFKVMPTYYGDAVPFGRFVLFD